MAEYRYLGKNQPRLAARDIVTGRAKYAADEKIAGMLWANLPFCGTSGSVQVWISTFPLQHNGNMRAGPVRQPRSTAERTSWKPEMQTRFLPK